MNISPFVLYGLIGCPHCETAEKYLRARNVPANLIIANDDPIAQQGALAIARQKAKDQAVGKSEEEIAAAVAAARDEYPLLVSRVTREVINGFKEDDYARVLSAYFAIASTSAPSVFSGQQQPQS
jgi:glutaredoxin